MNRTVYRLPQWAHYGIITVEQDQTMQLGEMSKALTAELQQP